MLLKILPQNFTVCKTADFSQVNFENEYTFTAKTKEENSLVCETKSVPKNTLFREDGWKCFKIEGVLDFSLVGILAEISRILAQEKIGIFAVSTFNTDYIFVKQENFTGAKKALLKAGHEVL